MRVYKDSVKLAGLVVEVHGDYGVLHFFFFKKKKKIIIANRNHQKHIEI